MLSKMYRIGLHAAKQPIEKNIAYIIICSVGRLPKLRIFGRADRLYMFTSQKA
jgi:hypothetical protein